MFFSFHKCFKQIIDLSPNEKMCYQSVYSSSKPVTFSVGNILPTSLGIIRQNRSYPLQNVLNEARASSRFRSHCAARMVSGWRFALAFVICRIDGV